MGVTVVAFEFGSQLGELDPFSFTSRNFASLCVPAAVESFRDGGGFDSPLQCLTFEFGSRVRRFPPRLFIETRQSFVFIPASLEVIDRPAIVSHYHPLPVVVDPGNTHFTVVDRTLMNFARTSVIHYFGEDSEIALDSMIEELGAFSFCSRTMTVFTFANPSRLRVIAKYAFLGCRHLGSILIPSTVEVIEEGAFINCSGLQQLAFATGSQLRLIEAEAFSGCNWLQPVDVPCSATICGLFTVVARVFDTDRSRRLRVRFHTPALRE
jgi:hypothetical protein